MEQIETIEAGYQLVLASSQLFQDNLARSFLEGFLENISRINNNYDLIKLDPLVDRQRLSEIYQKLANLENLPNNPKMWRKITQLVLLKGEVEQPWSANQQLTPDSIGLLFSLLIRTIAGNKRHLSILDPSIGTANLALTIIQSLQDLDFTIDYYGEDVDQILLEIASVNAELTQTNLRLIEQDGVTISFQTIFDLVIADPPIGFYSNPQVAQNFLCQATEAQTYIHHLLVERSFDNLQDGGWGIFLLPTNLLSSEQAVNFKKILGQKLFLQGVINLPDSLFYDQKMQKSIYLFQKVSNETSQKKVFLANLTNFSNRQELITLNRQFKTWFET